MRLDFHIAFHFNNWLFSLLYIYIYIVLPHVTHKDSAFFDRLSIDPKSVQNEHRERAKRVVYSVVYGVGKYTFVVTYFCHVNIAFISFLFEFKILFFNNSRVKNKESLMSSCISHAWFVFCFYLLFSQGKERLAETLGVSPEEAKAFTNSFLGKLMRMVKRHLVKRSFKYGTCFFLLFLLSSSYL